MRVAIIPETQEESNFASEFVIVPNGEYAVTADTVFSGVTSKGTPKLSIPFTVVGGVYPLDIGGLLPGQALIDGKRVVGPNEYVGAKFWFNLYLRNFFILSNIVVGDVGSLSHGQRKNAEIVAQELTTLGLPPANDHNDPFLYASFPMTGEEAAKIISDYLTEKYMNTPPQIRVKTEVYTYGDENTPAINVKNLRAYKTASKKVHTNREKRTSHPSYDAIAF